MTEKQLKPGRLLKKHMISEVAGFFKKVTNLFVTDCGQLTNKQMEDLRGRLKKTSNDYVVVKNSICIKALEKVKLENLTNLIKGTCGISFGSDDPIVTSKVLIDFAKENEKFQLKGAYIDGKIFSTDAIKKLASIPSRNVLLTELVSALNSPISGIVGTLAGIVRKPVYLFNAIKDKKEKEGK